MRTIIDITPEQLEGLERFRKRKRMSRAAVIREAIDRLLAEEGDEAAWREAFGAWKGHRDEAGVFLAELRAEWDRD